MGARRPLFTTLLVRVKKTYHDSQCHESRLDRSLEGSASLSGHRCRLELSHVLMDALAAEIARKRKASVDAKAALGSGGARKWVKKGELEQLRVAQYHESEAHAAEERIKLVHVWTLILRTHQEMRWRPASTYFPMFHPPGRH